MKKDFDDVICCSLFLRFTKYLMFFKNVPINVKENFRTFVAL